MRLHSVVQCSNMFDSVERSPFCALCRQPRKVTCCAGSVERLPVVHCLGQGRITVTAEVEQRLHPVVQCKTTVGRHVVVRFTFPEGLSVCP